MKMASFVFALILTFVVLVLIASIGLSLGGASFQFLSTDGGSLVLDDLTVRGNLSNPLVDNLQTNLLSLSNEYKPLRPTKIVLVRDGQCKLTLRQTNGDDFRFIRLYYSIIQVGVNAQPLLQQQYLLFNHTNLKLEFDTPQSVSIDIRECRPALYPYTHFVNIGTIFPFDLTFFQLENLSPMVSGLQFGLLEKDVFFEAVHSDWDTMDSKQVFTPTQQDDSSVGVQLVDTLMLRL